MGRGRRSVTATLLLVLTPALALAAPASRPAPTRLPLFRQALEQGAPAPYEVLLFHRGDLSTEDAARHEALEKARRGSGANAVFRTIDLEAPVDPLAAALWRSQHEPEPPWIVVRPPHPGTNAPAVWAGPLDAPSLGHLFDSPARHRIAARLLEGATAMWILLECGEAVRDEAAVDVLTASLRTLEKQLKPPGPTTSRSPLPLRIDFGLVRVTRSDLAEEFLVHLLEHGAPAVSTRPLAFAVFGRGRILGPLAGHDLDQEGIRRACRLLTSPPDGDGRQLPGRDLLLGADWTRVFQPASTGPAGRTSSAPSPAAPATAAPAGTAWLPWSRLAAGALLLTAAGAAWRARRRGRP